MIDENAALIGRCDAILEADANSTDEPMDVNIARLLKERNHYRDMAIALDKTMLELKAPQVRQSGVDSGMRFETVMTSAILLPDGKRLRLSLISSYEKMGMYGIIFYSAEGRDIGQWRPDSDVKDPVKYREKVLGQLDALFDVMS